MGSVPAPGCVYCCSTVAFYTSVGQDSDLLFLMEDLTKKRRRGQHTNKWGRVRRDENYCVSMWTVLYRIVAICETTGCLSAAAVAVSSTPPPLPSPPSSPPPVFSGCGGPREPQRPACRYGVGRDLRAAVLASRGRGRRSPQSGERINAISFSSIFCLIHKCLAFSSTASCGPFSFRLLWAMRVGGGEVQFGVCNCVCVCHCLQIFVLRSSFCHSRQEDGEGFVVFCAAG